MKCIKYITLLILFLWLKNSVYSQNRFKNSIESSFSLGRLLAHRPAMEKLVENNSYSFESTLNFNTNGTKIHHKYYKYPTYGLTLNYTNSGNKNNIGNIYSANGFINLPFSNNQNSLRFKFGLGLGWVEKIFHLENNYQNLAIGSHLNANIQIKIEKKVQLKNRQSIKYSVQLNHFSNGAFKTPNLGLNFVQLQISHQLAFKKQALDTSFKILEKNKKFILNYLNSSALKENQIPTLENFYINESTIQINYRKDIKSSYILGTDFLYNLSLESIEGRPIQSGLFFGYLMHFDKLKTGIEMGLYIYNKKEPKEILYHKIFTEYEILKNINLRLTLKTHWAKADFISIGIGYAF